MKNMKKWILVAAVSGLFMNIVSPVSAIEKPDLIIESFSAPATATQNEIISKKIRITVKNIGGSEAKDFIVAIILKGTVLRSDFPTAYHVMGSGQVAGLKAGQSATVTLQSFSVGTIVPPNKYEICAIADEGKKVNESDENNNWSKCQAISITLEKKG
jgi:subtilase family serine protease